VYHDMCVSEVKVSKKSYDVIITAPWHISLRHNHCSYFHCSHFLKLKSMCSMRSMRGGFIFRSHGHGHGHGVFILATSRALAKGMP
jgi:hypothetical protein